MEGTETSVVLPNGVPDPREHIRSEEAPDRVHVFNDTDLPNDDVERAVQTYFVENASLAWGRETTFQTYAAEGSLLARRAFRTPANILDEIKLARDLAERDDDIAAVMGQMVALAFEGGLRNQHRDEKTKALFNAIAREMDLMMVAHEMYRELLISSQINTTTLFTRERLEYTLEGADRVLEESAAAPLVGVMPAENVRVLGNDMFRTGVLAYEPDNEALRRWLDEYFSPTTTAARKAEMGRLDRVSANLFTGVVELSAADQLNPHELPVIGGKLYLLNPRMVKRTTFPKGSWKYPRPLLTRNFALLEAKRLLNIMDYALLQGGSNFIVVAKKGSDALPAQPAELQNLQNVVRKASKTGIIVGDHRLDFDIITPKLDELLNPKKRSLVGRKLAMAMLRLSETGIEEVSGEAVKSDDEMRARVIMSDRGIVLRHLENHAYDEAVSRNKTLFAKGRPSIFAPKIVLQGTQVFTDLILKLRDRGDIPRAWGVQYAGFDWDAAVEERRREVERGDDEVMQPGSVPHSSPDAGPQDNNPGRTPGGTDPAAPRKKLGQNQGETITAWMERVDGEEVFVRMGEQTRSILEQYPERSIGRMTTVEQAVMGDLSERAIQRASTIYVPLNPEYAIENPKAVRLTTGLSLIVGERVGSRAIVGKMLCFREPQFSPDQAEEYAVRWGFPVNLERESDDPAPDPSPELPPAPPVVSLHVTLPEGGMPPEEFATFASAMASAAASQHAPEIHIHPGGDPPE